MLPKLRKTRKKKTRPQTPLKSTVREFEVDGMKVVLTVKRIKNVNLRVKPGGFVAVSAPPWIQDRQIEAFVREKRAWIEQKQRALAIKPQHLVDDADPAQVAAWRAMVEAAVPDLIAQWESRMGVKAQKLAYRSMTSRWGSCNPTTGRICINVQLANFPPECLEYVVVHELCHLLERGHGPRFKALMDEFLPDWRSRRALLR
ncbi:MAG: SprT family zinc-dependent metalloprotease [Raoultibacter sp.]